MGRSDYRLQVSVIETHHPAIVQLVQSAFDHDVIMTQLMHKHRDVLESDYPDGLQELVTQYLQKIVKAHKVFFFNISSFYTQ
ncbi:hypothetical protein [Erysipelothrix anatis]|uniref:hypothetical protein n=1 Tax=Erysipelothrix anatis TaxID=2683713 RepID=UPI001357CA46|nr:hypothetical protein [Erysipelothrix anatis]